MVERLSGGQEAGGSIPPAPTSSVCVNCGGALVKRFSTTVFDADGGETVTRNTIVDPPAGAVVVAVHDNCVATRRREKSERRRHAVQLSLYMPLLFEQARDLEVEDAGKTYTVKNIKVVSRGQRVLMFMPQMVPVAQR